jgi:hypothetical protein
VTTNVKQHLLHEATQKNGSPSYDVEMDKAETNVRTMDQNDNLGAIDASGQATTTDITIGPDFDMTQSLRHILANKPRLTKFPIQWTINPMTDSAALSGQDMAIADNEEGGVQDVQDKYSEDDKDDMPRGYHDAQNENSNNSANDDNNDYLDMNEGDNEDEDDEDDKEIDLDDDEDEDEDEDEEVDEGDVDNKDSTGKHTDRIKTNLAVG